MLTYDFQLATYYNYSGKIMCIHGEGVQKLMGGSVLFVTNPMTPNFGHAVAASVVTDIHRHMYRVTTINPSRTAHAES